MIDKKLMVSITKKFNQPKSKVWDALTDKEKVKQYFFGTEVITDWQPGSNIVFKGEWEGNKYEDKGKIIEAEDGKKIKYSHLSSFSGLPDEPENYSVVAYEIETEGDSTILTITQEGFKDEKSRDDSKNGWELVLTGLQDLIK